MAIADIDHEAAGRASGLARRQRMLERGQRAVVLDNAIKATERADIGPELLDMAMKLAESATSSDMRPETALEVKQLAEAAKVLHTMARLELGESTANVAHASPQDHQAQRVELEARLAALRGTDDADTQG